MTNLTELKRLAEKAGGIEWHADMAVANDGAESRAIYHRPKPYHVVEIIETPDSALDNADCIHSESVWQFIAAANPKTILALISENSAALNLLAVIHGDGGQHVDSFGFIQSCVLAEQKIFKERSDFYTWMDIAKTVDEGAKRLADYAVTLEQERDQLRAEMEALRKDAELLDTLEKTVKIGSRSVPPHDEDSWQGIYAFRTQLQGISIRDALWSAIENEPAYMDYVRELNRK